MGEKTYIGDGVYATFDGFSIVLETSDGIRTTNSIAIEPEVWSNLLDFIRSTREQYSGGQQAQFERMFPVPEEKT